MRNIDMIIAENISKVYKIYNKRSDMLKEGLSLTRKKYHSLYYALHNVSFQIKKGDMVGIIGENGAGKSTLLKILTGVITPSEGNVQVNGKVAALLELGAGFNPDYTGKQNIYLNGTMMGFTRSEMNEKIEDIVNFADIGEFINQPVKNYSSGMFARLAFAVAINVEPEILIVDEALSVGDIFFQNKCFRKIKELKKKGVTILYVSHDLASVKEMCDHAIWLEKGSLKMVGECVEVCNEYSNALLKEKNEIYLDEANKNAALYNIETLDIQVEKLPAVHYTNESILHDKVKILSCFFTDLDGKIVNSFHIGERCIFHLVFESELNLPQCIAGFSLATVKGVWVMNPNTLISGMKGHLLVDGGSVNEVKFSFIVPKISTGSYVVEAAICNGVMDNYQTYTWLYNVGIIDILNMEEQYALLGVDTDITFVSCNKNT